jgi:hypothetical protein
MTRVWTSLSPSRRRFVVALMVGLGAFTLSEANAALPHPGFSDFIYIWAGARALLHGQNPYLAAHGYHPELWLFYPLTSVLFILPLGWLSFVHAQAIFVGVGLGAMAYAGWDRKPVLIGCASAGALWSVNAGQWSLLLTASALLPLLGCVWAVKPHIGFAFALGYANRVALTSAAVLTLLSFVVWPRWVPAWLAEIHRAPHVAPVVRPGGFILLASLLRWRRPEGRLFAALACIPQVGMLYDTVPFFLIPSTRMEAYLLAFLTQVAALVIQYRRTGLSLVEDNAHQWPVLMLLVYLPALAMLLRLPNSAHSTSVAP